MKNLPEPVQEFMKNREVAARFPEFHAGVIARCVAVLYPDGDTSKSPFPQRFGSAITFVRAASRAARIAGEAVGMTAKIDTGQKTITKGRVMEVGVITEISPVLHRRTRVRHRLRMTRPDGRSVDRLANVKRVHRWNEGRAE